MAVAQYSAMKPRILVVDDQPNLARIFRLVIELTGEFDVRELTRSLHVSEAAQTFQPDIVLLDIEMPHKNGAEIARELVRDGNVPSSSIIFLSGLIGMNESGMRDTINGPMRFLSKTSSPEQIVVAIRETLSLAAAA